MSDLMRNPMVFASARAIEGDENPEDFNPDGFIGISVDNKGHDFKFLPFGAGRRICPGINFGIASVEPVLASLLCTSNWELLPGMRKEDINTYVSSWCGNTQEY
ncbi:uncharacterized protein A4U43_C02F4360 [Asparagus officinalis]|uniref:Cytochrome P450 n=1 Tax=Asparagus officinalis TaxID=4686 RepID=A0A5P1FGN2_ASPOF|nr:uncharacterized protein A4U43_C02F4360 [Asparagus officinalis]